MQSNAERKFQSRRNDVTLTAVNGEALVRKRFSDEKLAEKENECYELFEKLGLRVPKRLGFERGELRLEYIEGKTALELLETQEREGAAELSPWRELTRWCCAFYEKTGLCLCDPNLRNFLLDAKSGRWYGIDFERCEKGDRDADFALLLAFTSLYRPENTALRREITDEMRKIFSAETGADGEKLKRLQRSAEAELAARRKARKNAK